MFGERLTVGLSALFVLVMTGLASAPPVVSSGVSPMGFLLSVLLVVIYVPERMPPWLLAVLSLLADAAIGTPFGFHGMVALAITMLLERRARSYQRQSPWFVWMMLGAYLLLAQVLFCVLAGVFGLQVSLQSALYAWFATIPFVVPLQWLFARVVKPAL